MGYITNMMSGNNMNQQIIQLKKKIRNLEIEIDYYENKEPENFFYLRKLNNQLNKLDVFFLNTLSVFLS